METQTKTNERVETVIPDAPPVYLPAAQTNDGTGKQFPPRGNLASALAAAQQKCKAASKDQTNTFHRYKYASAESVITEGKAALAETGLALAPISQQVNGSQDKGQDRYEMVRHFLLLHASGESLPIQVAWPIVVEKGRPLDKATAIGDTLSLAYLLRDLLLMPRVDSEDDLAGHGTAEGSAVRPVPASGQPTAPPAATPSTPPGKATAKQIQEIISLRQELRIPFPAWKAILDKRNVATARDLSTDEGDKLISALAHRANCQMLAEGLKGGAAPAAAPKSSNSTGK